MENFHDDSECYLLFGKEVNQIIAMLEILKDRNPHVEKLEDFVDKLKNMRSYDQMLDAMIMDTRAEDMQRREQQNEGLSLNEILSKFKIRKWNKADGKN
tara:strand:- start:47 stop:343 length:297 start_codon:yes stop_codon:yes gene_type:complete